MRETFQAVIMFEILHLFAKCYNSIFSIILFDSIRFHLVAAHELDVPFI